MKYKLENNVIKEDPTSSFVFEVIATASENPNDPDGKYGNFYPAVIPSGHIRQAAPQIATINNAEDPSGENQVQLVFPWQYDDINDKDHKTLIGDPTPWLRFATNAAGSSAVGQHYEDDKVLVGFVDGNVERPYVLGGLTTKGSGGSDIIHTTPGSHTFKLTDDPAGLSKFLTGMFLPVVVSTWLLLGVRSISVHSRVSRSLHLMATSPSKAKMYPLRRAITLSSYQVKM